MNAACLKVEPSLLRSVMALIEGLVHVYTGDAKGKTTAAVGLAVRALGRGLKVLIVQFLKGGGEPSGEMVFLGKEPGVELMRFKDQRHPVFCRKGGCDTEKLKASIRAGFDLAREKMMSGEFDLVVMDEINNCVKEGWLAEAEVLALMKEKPGHVELVLTGRGCPAGIIEAADYVTGMSLIKHPAQKGVMGRLGVEY
jgi:cob(I)alamin adenosyltransferase